jgi:hypothetical protein
MASRQATKTRSNEDAHVCQPPAPPCVGWLWYCPDCWSEFLYRPVASGELGRVINLWVLHWEPSNMAWTPLRARRRAAR